MMDPDSIALLMLNLCPGGLNMVRAKITLLSVTTTYLAIGACTPEGGSARLIYQDRTAYVCADTLTSVGAPEECAASSSSSSSTSSSSSSSSTSTSSGAATNDGAVTIAGTLNLTGVGASLTGGNLTFFKCVTTTLDSNVACVDQVESNGSFQLDCSSAFQNNAFGCFILEGPTEEALEIIGMLASKDFNLSESTNLAKMDVSFDKATGASKVKIEQLIVKSDGSTMAVDTSSLGAAIPNFLKNLNINDGTYNVCMQWLDRNMYNANKGEYPALDANSCWGELMYFAFTPATSKKLPHLEVWKDRKAYDRCHDEDGALSYHLSDGSNMVEFGSEGIRFRPLLDAIITNGWTDQSRIDYYNQQLSSSSEQQWVTDFKTIFGGSGACEAYADAAQTIFTSNKVTYGIPAWAANDPYIDPNWVWKECSVWDLNAADFPSLDASRFERARSEWMTQEACRQFKEGTLTQSQARTYAKDQCVAMYEINQMLAWAANDVVSSALWAFDEVRWGGQGADFRYVYEDLANASATAGTNMETDAPAVLAGTPALSALTQALALEYGNIDWHWERQQIFKCIGEAANLTALASSCNLSFNMNVGILSDGDSLGVTFWKLYQNDDPFYAWDVNYNNTASEFAQQQVCAQEYQLDLSTMNFSVNLGSDNDPESFWKKLEYGEVYDATWDYTYSAWKLRSSVADSKYDVVYNFLDYALTNNLVQACTKVRFADYKQQLDNSANNADDTWKPEDWILTDLAYRISESNWRNGLFALQLQDANGDSVDGAETSNETEATEDLAVLGPAVAQFALNNLDRWDAQYLLWDYCWFYGDLGSLSSLTLDGSAISLQCGAAVPSELSAKMNYACWDTTATCTFPAFDTWRTDVDRLFSLKQRLGDFKRWLGGGNTNDPYVQKKRDLKRNSMCIPNISLGYQPAPSTNSLGFTFPVTVKSPMHQKMAGELMPQMSADGSSIQKFMLVSTDFQTVTRGGDQGDCQWGEKKSITYASVNGSNSAISGLWTQSWVDTCWQDSATSNDNGWDQVMLATPLAQ